MHSKECVSAMRRTRSRDFRCRDGDHARGLLPGGGGGVVEQAAEGAAIGEAHNWLRDQGCLAEVEKVQADVCCKRGARRAAS